MGAVIHVTDATFEAEVLQSPLPTVVDLWAEWCMPCKRIAPIVEEIAAEYDGQLKMTKLDVDSNPDMPMQFGITGIPTLMVFKEGQLVDTIVGFMPKDRLLAKLQPHLN